MSKTIPMAIRLNEDVPDKIYEQMVEVIESCGYELFPSESSRNTDMSQYRDFDLKPKTSGHLRVVK